MGYDYVLSDLWGDSDEGSPSVVQWNATKVARYFDRSLRKAEWSNGFAMTNIIALATQLTKWRTVGKTEEEVTALIDFYMSNKQARGKNPGWKDFLYRAEEISDMLPTSDNEEEEETDPLLAEAHRLGTLEAFQRVYPNSPRMAKRSYEKYKEQNGSD